MKLVIMHSLYPHLVSKYFRQNLFSYEVSHTKEQVKRELIQAVSGLKNKRGKVFLAYCVGFSVRVENCSKQGL
jgi:hypothetical protein